MAPHRPTPQNWASLRPNGIGLTKPNHYKEMAQVAWKNRDQLGYAWRILNQGVCDGCALGTNGVHDWTIDGVHLCMIRLNLMRLNTMPAADHTLLEDVARLRGLDSRALRELGRLPYPMLRRPGEPGFRRVTWDEALDAVAERMRDVIRRDPDRLNFYLTSRGIPNETYFAFQKVARFLGTNNIDNASRICHAPSTSALSKSIGYGATTVSYSDWIGTDLLILVGTNLANNQPVATKYIHEAKKRGTRVVVVNPYKEEGLERYWVPSSVESAIFGTKIMDEFFQVSQGGDAAFFNGVLKHLIEIDKLDHVFIDRHTEGFAAVREHVAGLDWAALTRQSGASHEEIARFAEMYASAKSSIFVWSMGITQHRHGLQNVLSLSNLALALGRIGVPHSGLNPIRGHSGVQGSSEMGAAPSTYGLGTSVGEAGADQIEPLWGFRPPTRPGYVATEAIDAMAEGKVDLLYSVGGNFLETLPDPIYVKTALEQVPVRVFQDIVINPMMLLEPGELTVILPGATRYETPGGVTSTSTERRVIFSPEVPGRRIGEARPEWQIPMQIAQRVDPERANLITWADTAAIRQDIARTIPAYAQIAELKAKGDNFQWGGERLCADYTFNTPDGKAHFLPAAIPDQLVPEGWFSVSTRRGKQFNSMVWNEVDTLTGARRNQVFMAEADAVKLGLAEGDQIRLVNEHGEYTGVVRLSRIRPGNLQVHWPEGNGLLARGVTDESGVPEYYAVCRVEGAAGAAQARSATG